MVKAAADFSKANKIFFMHKTVDYGEAASIVKKPREGLVAYPFKRPKYTADQEQRTPSKRPSTEETESGT